MRGVAAHLKQRVGLPAALAFHPAENAPAAPPTEPATAAAEPVAAGQRAVQLANNTRRRPAKDADVEQERHCHRYGHVKGNTHANGHGNEQGEREHGRLGPAGPADGSKQMAQTNFFVHSRLTDGRRDHYNMCKVIMPCANHPNDLVPSSHGKTKKGLYNRPPSNCVPAPGLNPRPGGPCPARPSVRAWLVGWSVSQSVSQSPTHPRRTTTPTDGQKGSGGKQARRRSTR